MDGLLDIRGVKNMGTLYIRMFFAGAHSEESC